MHLQLFVPCMKEFQELQVVHVAPWMCILRLAQSGCHQNNEAGAYSNKLSSPSNSIKVVRDS
jgi:hypothetical protein